MPVAKDEAADDREEVFFHEVLQRPQGAEREAFLDQALRARLATLLQAHESPDPLLEPQAASPDSWLNQVEIYFSVVQRKVLTPNDFPSLPAGAQRLLAFRGYYEQIARPFDWKFTRTDLEKLVAKLRTPDAVALAA